MPYVDKPGGLLKITVAAKYPNEQVEECNWHVMASITGGGDSRALLGALVNSLMEARIIPHLATEVTYIGCRLMPILADAPYAPTIVTAAAAGTDTEPTLPTQVRLVVSEKTGLAGRAYRGRIYGFTPTSASENDSGHPNLTYRGAWEGLLDQFRVGATVGGTTWNLVIYHRLQVPKPYIQPTLVTSVLASGQWGTQRRSGDYGRTNVDPW